jgi:hypothetical protein
MVQTTNQNGSLKLFKKNRSTRKNNEPPSNQQLSTSGTSPALAPLQRALGPVRAGAVRAKPRDSHRRHWDQALMAEAQREKFQRRSGSEPIWAKGPRFFEPPHMGYGEVYAEENKK